MDYLGIDLSCAIGSLRNGEIPEKDCLLPLMSKLLGYCIVAASTTVKLPQILKILKHKSVRGLSVVAFELEVVGFTIALAYCLHKGLPFSAFGELVFLLIQAIILVATIYYFSQPVPVTTWIRALLYCAVAPTVLAGQIDPMLFEALYASQHAIFFIARIPQIWKNFRNKSTGELSFLTSFMNFGGSMVRVFTSIQENAPASDMHREFVSSDEFWILVIRYFNIFAAFFIFYTGLETFIFLNSSIVTLGSVFGVLTNGTILSQILIYHKPSAPKEKKEE